MKKEEILEKSRLENKKKDEMEARAFDKAGRIACGVGGIVCALIILFESLFSDKVSSSTWGVFLSISGTMLLVKYIQLKKLHELIFAILELLLAVIFIVVYVIKLVG